MKNLAALVLFAVSLTVSATLLFLMEPMIAKMLLPLLGGSPAVWNTCMVFFQLTLLIGYLYAHLVCTRLDVRKQLIVHVIVLLLPLIVLPTTVQGRIAPLPEQDPILWLLATLTMVVGLPFFAVSTSSPLLQNWFANLKLKSSSDPYFLFTASNFGSLMGLLSYPFVIEPKWTLSEQSRYWQIGYFVLLLLTFLCGYLRFRAIQAPQAATEEVEQEDSGKTTEEAAGGSVTSQRRWQWILYTALPSSFVLGLTTHVSVEMAAMPLLWVIPLAVYLLTIMLAFARLPAVVYRVLGYSLPWFIVANFILVSMTTVGRGIHNVQVGLPLHLITLFVVSLCFHGKVAADRPETRHLTEFYLFFSVGGMLGSMINALVAPVVFDSPLEYPLVLAAIFILWVSDPIRKKSWPTDKYFPSWVLPCVIAVLAYVLFSDPMRDFWLGSQQRHLQVKLFDQSFRVLTPLLIALFLAKNKRELRASLIALFFIATVVGSQDKSVVHRERNFFGVLTVRVLHQMGVVDFIHDTTLHGEQNLDPEIKHQPISYYTPTNTIGMLLIKLFGEPDEPGKVAQGKALPPFAVVGLGTGACTAYAHKDQEVDLYEINPKVVQIATNPFYFTYLYSAYKRGVKMNFLLGDARIKMQGVPDDRYGLIILDAFSGDAAPCHLMTREALELYRKKLAPGGIIAYHCSSKYYDVIAEVWNLVQDAHLDALVCYGDLPDRNKRKAGSLWVFVSEDKKKLEAIKQKDVWLWAPVDTKTQERVWTDDYCNPVAFFKNRYFEVGLVEVYRKPDGTLGQRFVQQQ